jgi:phosphatidate cytidylyltransferase
MSAEAARWGDLKPRVISALVMIVVGAVEIWLGGFPFLIFVTILTAVMIWELAALSMPSPSRWPLVLAGLAAACMWVDEGWPSIPAWAVFPIPVLIFALRARITPIVTAAFALAILVAGHGLFVFRDEEGTAAIIWLLGVVIVSDVMGYFAGRTLGGPKFWPAVSPKKTWSGTIAGWLGAAMLGLGFVLTGHGGWSLVILSPLVAFAGQMGDIAESWIKRKAGVKDASNLIPGHGGVMDRFDALTGAMVAVMVLGNLVPIPVW